MHKPQDPPKSADSNDQHGPPPRIEFTPEMTLAQFLPWLMRHEGVLGVRRVDDDNQPPHLLVYAETGGRRRYWTSLKVAEIEMINAGDDADHLLTVRGCECLQATASRGE